MNRPIYTQSNILYPLFYKKNTNPSAGPSNRIKWNLPNRIPEPVGGGGVVGGCHGGYPVHNNRPYRRPRFRRLPIPYSPPPHRGGGGAVGNRSRPAGVSSIPSLSVRGTPPPPHPAVRGPVSGEAQPDRCGGPRGQRLPPGAGIADPSPCPPLRCAGTPPPPVLIAA